jgi:hypothetical protein
MQGRLMSIVIHHNPDCGSSRNVLEIIRGFAGQTVRFALLDVASGASYAKQDIEVVTAP